MKLRTVLLAASIAFAPAPVAAQVSQDYSLAPAGEYAIDPAHTRITWKLSHLGTSFYNGWFAKFDAKLNFNPAAPEKSELEASVDTASVFTLDPKFNVEIASAKFLDASKTPVIAFKATELAKTGPNTGTMTGDLTLHGVTKPVTFDVTFIGGMQSPMKNAYVIGFSATTTFKRSDFGITEYLNFGLGDEITVTVDTEFDKKGD
jgi:polyisoprenoid-binding protein YceI